MNRNGWGFGQRSFGFGALALIVAVLMPAALASAEETIGVAAAAHNRVDGIMGGQTTPLKVGSPVYQNQHVRTAAASTAQLLFRDQTSLSVGPSSEVTLDKFVYDPTTNSGSAVLTATRGAFRFVSGTQQPHNYQVRTPVATIGVRGTVVDTIVTDTSTSVILGECCADITLQTCTAEGGNPQPAAPPPPPPEGTQAPQSAPNTECLYHLDVVGQGFTIFDDGRVDGPFVFDGSETDGVRSTTFPLHTSQFAIESHDPESQSGLGDSLASDAAAAANETTIDQEICQGPDCGCPDCGPGF